MSFSANNVIDKFYIDGVWVEPHGTSELELVNPATEEKFSTLRLGDECDVNDAVNAARKAFSFYSLYSIEQRLDLLKNILDVYSRYHDELAYALTREMGAPISLSKNAQVVVGREQLTLMIDVLARFEFEQQRGTSRIIKEPIGVCAMITPWNWPLNLIMTKVAPALAAGCTMILKPSEIAPTSALILAKVMSEAGVPKGVFNVINGDGPVVGQALAAHADVDMVSITGSTTAGIKIAKAAANTVKRVHQELGGKSANIILDDADMEDAVKQGVLKCFSNCGQSCNAPSRLLVPEKYYDEACKIAVAAANTLVVGSPDNETTTLGPVASLSQFSRIQDYIQSGIDQGATLICGGLGRPDDIDCGFYVKPTIFADVTTTMTIAREEIFGPVLVLIKYTSDEEAAAIANDSLFGLAAYIEGKDRQRVRSLARKIRVGDVYLNYPAMDLHSPFGGVKQSGNGREYAEFGLDSYLELKAIIGYGD